jgi:hypothetical protein
MEIVTDDKSGRKIFVRPDELHEVNEHGVDIESVIGSDYRAIAERASVAQIIEFANVVRNAGGGEIISDLMPSYPQDPNSCLIANALNFNCRVDGYSGEDWAMRVEEEELARKIATAIDSEYHYEGSYSNEFAIVLPYEIAMVAKAFDSYRDVELETYNKEYKK